jgi:hypothetical protein
MRCHQSGLNVRVWNGYRTPLSWHQTLLGWHPADLSDHSSPPYSASSSFLHCFSPHSSSPLFRCLLCSAGASVPHAPALASSAAQPSSGLLQASACSSQSVGPHTMATDLQMRSAPLLSSWPHSLHFILPPFAPGVSSSTWSDSLPYLGALLGFFWVVGGVVGAPTRGSQRWHN